MYYHISYAVEYEKVYQFCPPRDTFSNLQSAYLACSQDKSCLGISSGGCAVDRGKFELCVTALQQDRFNKKLKKDPRLNPCIYKKKQTHSMWIVLSILYIASLNFILRKCLHACIINFHNVLAFTNEFLLLTNGTRCITSNTDILKSFNFNSEIPADSSVVLKECEMFCSRHQQCKACSVECNQGCRWNAIINCDGYEEIQETNNGNMSMKPGLYIYFYEIIERLTKM